MRSSPCPSPMAPAQALPEASQATAALIAGPVRAQLPAPPQVAAVEHGLAANRPAAAGEPGQVRARSHLARAGLGFVSLAALWAVLTGGAAESWVFGAPAVLVGTALIFAQPAAPRWRLSPLGALRFALWFAVQSVRGATDVAWRALAWRLPLAPGCRLYRTALPEGAPRMLFANAITLLPGTLTAEIEGDLLVVHMLDTRVHLGAELHALEARTAALFALSVRQGQVEGWA